MIVQEDLKEISNKIKSIYTNVKNIENKNEDIIQKIDCMINIEKDKDKIEKKQTKVMPAVFVF